MEQNEVVLFKVFNKKGEVIYKKNVLFKKFRLMSELQKLEKEGIDSSSVDIEKTIEFLNDNNSGLRIKSIMVVDDEFVLRELYTEQLSRLCHYVKEFDNAIDALSEFSKNPMKYDFILSDNIMPQMKGDEFADKIKELKPDMPIFIITGDTHSVNEESFTNSVSGIIQKPINSEKLQNFVGNGKIQIFNIEFINKEKVA